MSDTLADVDHGLTLTSAARAAICNLTSNLASLHHHQPHVAEAVDFALPPIEFVWARDHSLTGMHEGQRWWKACSLPMRASQFMLREADLSGVVTCVLLPTHAALLRAVFQCLTPAQAVIAVTPDAANLHMILSCDDFTNEIDRSRLFFVQGGDWESKLRELMQEQMGLPVPTAFLRPVAVDTSAADEMIPIARKLFADISHDRSAKTAAARSAWRPTGRKRICVAAPSAFRLWDSAGPVLRKLMVESRDSIDSVLFDSDNPASASPLALAMAACQTDALVTPIMSRADFPDLIPQEMPWTTWLTTPRIPVASAAGPFDSLILADKRWKSIAVEAGWKPEQLFIGAWPQRVSVEDKRAQSPGVFEIPPAPVLGIISDIRSLEPSKRIAEFSSHRLLWEAIADELLNDPFKVGQSANRYLRNRMRRFEIAEEDFDQPAFTDGVITHAYKQGLAKLLIHSGIPVKLFGKRWDAFEGFAPHCGGVIESEGQLGETIDGLTALVHTWPTPYSHPMDAAGKPVLRGETSATEFLRDARAALAGKYKGRRVQEEPISAATILKALESGD